MSLRPEESRFVRLVMKDASEAEIAEATRNWFSYLQSLIAIASDAERDSHKEDQYVRFESDTHTDV
jgi:hypothetical protein